MPNSAHKLKQCHHLVRTAVHNLTSKTRAAVLLRFVKDKRIAYI